MRTDGYEERWTDGWTDLHVKANRRFLWLCERAQECYSSARTMQMSAWMHRHCVIVKVRGHGHIWPYTVSGLCKCMVHMSNSDRDLSIRSSGIWHSVVWFKLFIAASMPKRHHFGKGAWGRRGGSWCPLTTIHFLLFNRQSVFPYKVYITHVYGEKKIDGASSQISKEFTFSIFSRSL
jgi:hypothetical protein